MEISISTGLYYKRDYKNILDIIKASGAKNIELMLNQAFIDIPIETIKKELEERELKVTSIHLPLTFIAYERDEDEEYWIIKCLHYLRKLHSNTLITHFFYEKNDKNISNDENHFRNIIQYTEQSNQFVCTENMPKISLKTMHQNPNALDSFLKKNNCYLTYDISHVATHGRCIIEDYYRYKDNIRNIHLSDYSNGNEHKLLGEGELPIEEFIKVLRDENYQYPITLEFDFENPLRNKAMTDDEAIYSLSKSIKLVEKIVKS